MIANKLFIFDCRFAQESPGEISFNAQKHPKIREYCNQTPVSGISGRFP